METKYHHEQLAQAIRKVNGTKELQFGKEKLKVSLFADDMVVYINDPKNSTRKLL